MLFLNLQIPSSIFGSNISAAGKLNETDYINYIIQGTDYINPPKTRNKTKYQQLVQT